MLTIKYQTAFKKDYKRVKKRGYNISLLEEVIDKLANQEELDKKYKDHALVGQWIGFRECHIALDWLLIYQISGEQCFFARTGTHADLFSL